MHQKIIKNAPKTKLGTIPLLTKNQKIYKNQKLTKKSKINKTPKFNKKSKNLYKKSKFNTKNQKFNKKIKNAPKTKLGTISLFRNDLELVPKRREPQQRPLSPRCGTRS